MLADPVNDADLPVFREAIERAKEQLKDDDD